MYLTDSVLLALVLCFTCCTCQLAKQESKDEILERHKRVIPFLQTAGCGFIAAMAIPLQNIGRHVFLAFNFEAHYGLADNNTFSPSGVNQWFKGKRSVDDAMPSSLPTTNEIESTPLRSKTKTNKLFTRTRVYGAIKKNLVKLGYNGTSCLLKIICETAEVPVNPNNGLLGSIFHIVFTPSSSDDEGLPNQFYDAENSGTMGNCAEYNSYCPNNMLDTISKTMFLKLS